MDKFAFIDKAFTAMSIVDGAKQMKNSYNSTNNKYDNILSTNVVKPNKNTGMMGASNASIANPIYQNKVAFDMVNNIYKEAGLSNNISKVKGAISKGIKNYDANTAKIFANAKNNFVDKKIGAGLKDYSKGMARLAPGLAGAGAVGYGVTKSINSIDKKLNSDKSEFKTPARLAGGAIATGLALKTLSSKSPAKAFGLAGVLAKDKLVKTPLERLGRRSKGANTIIREVKKINNDIINKDRNIRAASKNIETILKRDKAFKGMNMAEAKKTFFDREKANFLAKADIEMLSKKEQEKRWLSRKVMLNDAFNHLNEKANAKNRSLNESANIANMKELLNVRLKSITNNTTNYTLNHKKAFDELDKSFEKIASMAYAKKVFKDHFLKKGLESIPWYAAPATVGYLMNKSIQRKNSPSPRNDDHVKEINVKLASFNVNKGQVKKFGKAAIEKGAEGLGRTLFPAAITAATGRNIMNSFNKIDRENHFNTQEAIANRIVINLEGSTPKSAKAKRKLKNRVNKEVSKQLGDIMKNAEYDIGDINTVLKKDVDRAINRNKSIVTNKIHVGNGLKKKQRFHG